MILISGSANPPLARKIAIALHVPLTEVEINKFSDGEIKVTMNAKIRGKDVVIIQSTSPPVNDNLIELCLLVNAARRAGARTIILVAAYLGYMRQDFAAAQPKAAQSTEVIAAIINSIGIDHLITLDLHSNNTADLFKCKFTNLSCQKIFKFDLQQKNLSDFVIIAPDIGGVKRATQFAQALHVELAVTHKLRTETNTPLVSICGNVQDRVCIILDDIIDSAHTIYNVANALKKMHARTIYVYATHGVLSTNAVQILNESACEEIVITDTIELGNNSLNCNKLRQISVAAIIAENINNLIDMPHNICHC